MALPYDAAAIVCRLLGRIALSHVGIPIPRLEDEPLLRGAARFVADLRIEGCFEVAFARSAQAHGRLVGLSLDAARTSPGVVAAYGNRDLGLPDLGFPPRVEAPDEMKRPVLARDKVRYVGEPVALIVAEDRYAAEDAAERCVARVDPLPAVVDPGEAERSIEVFDGLANVAFTRSVGEPLDDVFASAPVIVEESYSVGRVAHTALEGRAILVEPREDGRLEVWCSTQAPHRLRDALARTLTLEPGHVRVRAPHVGGAFGGKSQTYPEYLAVARAALMLQRPLRWIEDRHEALVASSHGRGQLQKVRLAADHDGRLLAADVRLVADLGAYPHDGGAVPRMTMWVTSGCYAIPRLYAEVKGVVTNKVPTASYRGAGRPEAAHAIERTIDVLARRLGIDPAELRLRNFISPDRFPYRSPTGAVYDSGGYAEALERALAEVGYDALRREQEQRRGRRDPLALGVGIASYIERSGGQSGSSEWGRVELHEGGSIVAITGTASQGQGHVTSLSQIVASVFDVPLRQVEVVEGDTARIERGTGTFGSRSIQVGGGALHEAGEAVLAEAREAAAAIAGIAPGELGYAGGAFVAGSSRLTLADVVAEHGSFAREVEFSPPQAFPFGTHVAVVEVDTETGRVTLRRLVLVDDCGRILNPLLAMGQAIGSAVQGLGQALYEWIDHDADGSPSAGSLVEYSIPTLPVVPRIDARHTETPNPNVVLGTKGAGEAGCIGVPPAIANAVADALELTSHAGLTLPLLPERVWKAAAGAAPAE